MKKPRIYAEEGSRLAAGKTDEENIRETVSDVLNGPSMISGDSRYQSIVPSPPLLEESEIFRSGKKAFNNQLLNTESLREKGNNLQKSNDVKDDSIVVMSGAKRYKSLDEFLGEGTYGRVEKAVDTMTQKIVAIKKVKVNTISSNKKTSDSKNEKETFMNENVGHLGVHFTVVRELRVMREIRHENIMNALDLYIEKDFICLVMEVMSTDLKKVVDRKIRLSESHIKCLIQQILKGLHALHSMYILHRDLSPANVFINQEGICRIADFGLARSYATHVHTTHTSLPQAVGCRNLSEIKGKEEEPKQSSNEMKSTSGSEASDPSETNKSQIGVQAPSTQHSKIAGTNSTREVFICSNKDLMTSKVVTLWYRSPELLYGAVRYGPGVDIWSVGCILAELLAGRPLFPGTSEVDQLAKIFSLRGSPCKTISQSSMIKSGDLDAKLPPNFWPDVSSLPCFFSFTHCEPKQLKSFFPNCSYDGLDLLDQLLCLDPKRRPNAEQALRHRWFHSQPVPSLPSQLPLSSLHK